MQMDKGMDTGPILSQRAESIRPDDTTGSLGERLGELGAALLIETLPCYIEGKILPKPQPEQGATLCRRIKKEHARIDWTQPAVTIERMVRAFQPWPGAFSFWRGQMLKIGEATVVPGSAEPGKVMAWEKGAAIGTGAGLLAPLRLQLPGKKMLPIEVFLRGRPDFIGSTLEI
jgi:methionyl-tRNA formyltransferase